MITYFTTSASFSFHTASLLQNPLDPSQIPRVKLISKFQCLAASIKQQQFGPNDQATWNNVELTFLTLIRIVSMLCNHGAPTWYLTYTKP